MNAPDLTKKLKELLMGCESLNVGRRSVSSEWIYISRRSARKAGKAFVKELQGGVAHGGNSGAHNGPITYWGGVDFLGKIK